MTSSESSDRGLSQGAALEGSQEIDDRERGTSPEDSRDSESIVIASSAPKRKKRFRARGYDDDEETDWWFASTAVPLLAATIAPLANVTSIAALITYWRMNLIGPDGKDLAEMDGIHFKDPIWCYWLNVGSLICGFVGNLFLLFNFTGRIRYIVALPLTIILWYIATAILVALTICMNIYFPPHRPEQTYTQGFWYAVISAVLYFVCSMLLMFNMVGYFLGHYPQRFNLSDHQRTLILQTMLFFVWLAGGAGMFAAIESNRGESDWSFVDGLYFCDVTILTIGFGDLTMHNNLGQGLVFPYSIGGIIMLGLVISSINKFAREMGEENVVRKHIERKRSRTVSLAVRDSQELQLRQWDAQVQARQRSLSKRNISSPLNVVSRLRPSMRTNEQVDTNPAIVPLSQRGRRMSFVPAVNNRISMHEATRRQQTKLRLLRDEKDRFDEMRRIQMATARFRKWWALTLSISGFLILWLVGAVGFWQLEKDIQGMTYFQALYFCYVSLLTIGYGDKAPQSNGGRPLFVVWSLVAVPTMTILISDMSDTVIDSFKRGTFKAADFTVLPKVGIWHSYLQKHPRFMKWLAKFFMFKDRGSKKSPKITDKGHSTKGNIPFPHPEVTDTADMEKQPSDTALSPPALSEIKEEDEGSGSGGGSAGDKKISDETVMARRLAVAIREVTDHVKTERNKKYTFEEWEELRQLIQFTSDVQEPAKRDADGLLVYWDWIGENSPMMSYVSEPEFVLDRLLESLGRHLKRMEMRVLGTATSREEKGEEPEEEEPEGEESEREVSPGTHIVWESSVTD